MDREKYPPDSHQIMENVRVFPALLDEAKRVIQGKTAYEINMLLERCAIKYKEDWTLYLVLLSIIGLDLRATYTDKDVIEAVAAMTDDSTGGISDAACLASATHTEIMEHGFADCDFNYYRCSKLLNKIGLH